MLGGEFKAAYPTQETSHRDVATNKTLMRILITGITGFIGQHVFSSLRDRDYELLALLHKHSLLPGKQESSATASQLSRKAEIPWRNQSIYFPIRQENKIRTLKGDLNDLAAIKNDLKIFDPEVVIHLAWEGIPDFSFRMSQINLLNSIRLVDFLLDETHCRKIVIAGSCFECGSIQGKCSEAQYFTLNSFFVWAKQSLYHYALLRCDEAKVDLVWPRLFYVYGPGQKRKSLIPILVDAFTDGRIPEIQNPWNANDFVDVEDVARAFLLAVEKTIDSGVYNLGSGRSTEVIKICEIVERQITGKTQMTQQLKNQRRDVKQSVNFWADTSKTENALGWQVQVPVEEGIRRYINWAQSVMLNRGAEC